ncbi:Beta-lactamase [Fulvivirga imtechensis AK7]|uniref:Beta-lactamase n=1 Tax=Fulvivirga imtechensis AK7 TaxID=1237149 RepID=L8JRU2_9BACT|nr:Beta-lactamase [Fulvivirga imtechensis AK7]
MEGAFIKTNTPGASLAIVKDGTVIYQKAFGVKSAGGKDSVDIDTRFRIASVSKGFSAVLAGLVARDSLLCWDDNMIHYLKYPVQGKMKDITIRNILSHTCGFQYQAYSTLVEDELPRDAIISRLLTLKLSRHPGDIHSYQNVAYSLIEPILESIYDRPFTELMTDQIFTPLGMSHTTISYDSMINGVNVAMPHGYRRGAFVPATIKSSYYNVAAAGGINSSISDMAQWLRAMLGYRPEVVPHEVLDQVFEPVISMRVKNPYFSQLYKPRSGYYGMGWRIIEYPEDTIIYHGGYANGYKSGIAFDRDKKIGICVLTNAPSKFSNLVLTQFFTMYNEYFEQKKNFNGTDLVVMN